MRRTGQKLGQHFLNAAWVARDLIESLSIQEGEDILEIGPGKGALTEKLLETGNRVVAVEKDQNLVTYLESAFAPALQSGMLELCREDIRDFAPQAHGLVAQRYVLAANIPYYITGEIIRQFLETNSQPRAMALLIQKEVAERIVARDGKESILSTSVKAYGIPSIVAKVPSGYFSPPPSVDSAILRVNNISKQFFNEVSEKLFFQIVKTGFSAKRKMLAGNLSNVFGDRAMAALQAAQINLKVRAEDLRLEDWGRLATFLSE